MISFQNSFRCCWRLIHLMILFLTGIITCVLLRIKYGPKWHFTVKGGLKIQLWMQKASNIIGLKITVSGKFNELPPSLIVANHISWLDIIALASSVKSSFVSKSDLQKWPVIGGLAINIGTIFISRNSKHDLNSAIKSITSLIKQGKPVILFPEGTTTNGYSIKSFKSSLFQSAINANCDIQTVTIMYVRKNQLDLLAPYIDKNNFITHLIRIMSQPKTTVTLFINTEKISTNLNRRELSLISQEQIKSTLEYNRANK